MRAREVDSFFIELGKIGSDSLAEKTAGVKEFAQTLYRIHKPSLIGGAIGGGVMGAAGYLRAKRWKGKPSAMEQDAREYLDYRDFQDNRTKARGKPIGYSAKMDRVLAEANANAAKAMSEHPLGAIATFAAFGAPLGASIYRTVSKAGG